MAESGPGEARVYGIRLQGFDHLDDEEIEKITFNHKDSAATEFHLFRHEASGAVFVEDPNREKEPLAVLPRAAEEFADNNPESTSHTERLESWVGGSPEAAQFAAGVLYGFGQGGVDLVVGIGELWYGSVTYAGEELASGAAIFELGLAELNPFSSDAYKERLHLQITLAQDDLAQRRQNIADIAQAAAELVKWVEEAKTDALISVFLRPFDAAVSTQANHRLGEKNQQILEITSMLLGSVVNTWSTASAADKGRYTGIMLFEVASSFITVSKVGKISKAKWLSEIAKRDIRVPGANLIKSKANALAAKFSTTKMCFVAGTIVATASLDDDLAHFTPIEQINETSLVWAKDESTGEVAKKRVLQLFITHPDHLHHVRIDTDGDGQADETLSGTAEHPFWDQDTNEWVRMGDLEEDQRLLLLDRNKSTAVQTSAYVLENQRQNAPPSEIFTTYNFEVEDFHTYFVGESGVWVHNHGAAWCQELFAVHHRVQEKVGDMWDAYDDLLRNPPAKFVQETGDRWKLKMFNEVRRRYFDGETARGSGWWRKLGDQDLTKPHNAKTLATNLENALGLPRIPGFNPHHIVANHASGTGELHNLSRMCRNILTEKGINPNEASNGIWLPNKDTFDGVYGPSHANIHTTDYYRKLLERLDEVRNGSADDVRDTLQEVATLMTEGRFP